MPNLARLYTGWAPSTAHQAQTYFERQILPRLDALRLEEDLTAQLEDIVDTLINKAQIEVERKEYEMKLYSPKEMSKIWGVTESLVRRYCRDGRIPSAIIEDGAVTMAIR